MDSPSISRFRTPRVALDFRWLDHLTIGNGQYRYSVDLIRGLAQRQPPLDFLVIGSRPEPAPEIRHVFDGKHWRYRFLPRWRWRGHQYADQFRYSWLLRREDVDLLHSLHTFIPMLPGCRSVVTVYDLMYEIFPEYAAAIASKPYRRFKTAVQKHT